MRPTVSLAISSPCAESWDAMTPTATGRHCAACQKTVVDFTLKTDAEILAHLTQAAGGVCGRLWSDQLRRPLRPAMAPPVSGRWRTWLAAVTSVWALREAAAAPALGQAAAGLHAPHPRKKPSRPIPRASLPALHVRGVVLDALSREPVAGVAVFLKGQNRTSTTDSAGRFSMRLAAGRLSPGRQAVVLHRFGYQSQTVFVALAGKATALTVALNPNGAAGGAEIVAQAPATERRFITSGAVCIMEVKELVVPAKPPRALGRFCHWLTRPFRRFAH
ncbi:MAG TPA: carboxypeptidase-like regulatory domain-containing protein [Hymenobacter sp.]|jgi:hypothetical protein|uniref:carboxypeptidase-like regulatory domain-containing protein n=1 Tax=Hymenobacter sp. TaxID=1898978 RepID=UPI002EDB5094